MRLITHTYVIHLLQTEQHFLALKHQWNGFIGFEVVLQRKEQLQPCDGHSFYIVSDYSDRWRRHKCGLLELLIHLIVSVSAYCMAVMFRCSHGTVLVWVCCCRYRWENEIWATKSGWSDTKTLYSISMLLLGQFSSPPNLESSELRQKIVCSCILMLVRWTVPGMCTWMYLIGQCFMLPGAARRRVFCQLGLQLLMVVGM